MASVDTQDLEALFDQIVAEKALEEKSAPAPVKKTPAPVNGKEPAGHDADVAHPGNGAAAPGDDLYHRIGRLTRVLHDTLHELGYDKTLENSVIALPDARDRLAYIASLTEQAAERALNAVEKGQAMQQQVAQDAQQLAEQWQKLYRNALSLDDFKSLAGSTRDFLAALPKRAKDTHAQLHEIMMAQDFHDLTGQMIMKIVALARTMEDQLVSLLVETAKTDEPQNPMGLAGPQMNANGRSDVVTSQSQVDELLESLGF